MRECCGQGLAEVVSNSRNKVHQTWAPTFSRTLYLSVIKEYLSPFQRTDKATSWVNHRRPKQPRGDLLRRREESPLAASAALPRQPAAGGAPPARTLSPATTLSTSTSPRRRRVPSAPGPTSARGRRTSPEEVAHFTSLFSAYYMNLQGGYLGCF